MAATKRSTRAGKGATIPAAKVASIIAISKELMQLQDETAAREAERSARAEAIADRGEHPMKYLTDEDITEVSQRIEVVALSLLSIRQIAGEIIEADRNAAANFAFAIQEMARANVKGIDACIERLAGGPALGNFAGEFSDEDLQ